MDEAVQLDLHEIIDALPDISWDGKQPLIVFDGVCVLCSGFIHWVIAHDKEQKFLFTTAQSELGQAFYRHLKMDMNDFETNLVIIGGELFIRMQAFFIVCHVIGWPWRLFNIFDCLPNVVLDWIYERIKRNRYSVFGRREECMVPDPALKTRFIL